MYYVFLNKQAIPCKLTRNGLLTFLNLEHFSDLISQIFTLAFLKIVEVLIVMRTLFHHLGQGKTNRRNKGYEDKHDNHR